MRVGKGGLMHALETGDAVVAIGKGSVDVLSRMSAQ